MSALPDIIIPAKTILPIDQMDRGMDLLEIVLAALQDHTFIDRGTLRSLSGVMFAAIETLAPVRDAINNMGREAK